MINYSSRSIKASTIVNRSTQYKLINKLAQYQTY